jgi:3-oxoacyl-[acyl-carrier protein] reductase
MIDKGWGRVIHISSISAVMLRGNPLYASAKAFLNAYVTTVGRTFASSGVVISAVMPGAVAFPGSYWDQYKVTDPVRCEDFLRHHQAANRFGTTKEIADVVLFMASEKASFMQAALVPVDGANM